MSLPNKMKVRVLKKDTVLAEKGHGNRCPQAEAIYRLFGDDVERVQVGTESIGLTEKSTGRRFRVKTPQAAVLFAKEWDQSDGVPKKLPSFIIDLDQAKVKEPRAVRAYNTEARRKATGSAVVKNPGSGTRKRREN